MENSSRTVLSIRLGFVLVEIFHGIDIPHMIVSRVFFYFRLQYRDFG